MISWGAKGVRDSQACEAQFRPIIFSYFCTICLPHVSFSLFLLLFIHVFSLFSIISVLTFAEYLPIFNSSSSSILFLLLFCFTPFSFFFIDGCVIIFCSSCVCCAAVGLSCRPWCSGKGSFPPTLRAFFPGSQGRASQMSPADTQLSKHCIPGSKHSY